MKKLSLGILVSLSLCSFSLVAFGSDDPITDQEKASTGTEKESKWESAIEKKYNLTDAQIDKLKSEGWTYPQIAIAADLAKTSGKSLDDIVKMRDSKMGWGKIAKELGVPPKEIGQSIASLRKDVRADRAHDRAERREHHDRDHDRDDRDHDRDHDHDHGDHDHGAGHDSGSGKH